MLPFERIADRFWGRESGDASCFWTRAGVAHRTGVASTDGVSALWAEIGLHVSCCSNTLTEQSWLKLYELGDFDPTWLVEHAYWVQLASGKQTAPLLADILRRHPWLDVSRALDDLRSYEPPSGGRWVDAVLEQIRL